MRQAEEAVPPREFLIILAILASRGTQLHSEGCWNRLERAVEGSGKIAEAKREEKEFLSIWRRCEAATNRRMLGGNYIFCGRRRCQRRRRPTAGDHSDRVPKRLPGAWSDDMEDEPDAWTKQADEGMEESRH